jgi:IS30 family transposase
MEYSHFTIEERESILSFSAQGFSQAEISRKLNRNRSSIKRELDRNTVNGKLSPEAISGRMKLENKNTVSFSTIYRGIKTGIIGVTEKSVLVRKGKVKPRNTEEKRGKIVDRKVIEDRPVEANERSKIGHYELDTVIGKGKQGAILTCVDRNSRYLIGSLMEDRKSLTLSNTLIEDFFEIPLDKRKTFTSDNGKEFSRLTESEVDEVIMLINLMPKKCLGWLTPFEVFWGESFI